MRRSSKSGFGNLSRSSLFKAAVSDPFSPQPFLQRPHHGTVTTSAGVQPVASLTKEERDLEHQKGRKLFITLCSAPAVILFFVFMIIPTFNVFKMSLYKWGGFSSKRTFVGLENFQKLFKDMKFFQSFQNTVLLIVLVSIITMSLALFFAGHPFA